MVVIQQKLQITTVPPLPPSSPQIRFDTLFVNICIYSYLPFTVKCKLKQLFGNSEVIKKPKSCGGFHTGGVKLFSFLKEPFSRILSRDICIRVCMLVCVLDCVCVFCVLLIRLTLSLSRIMSINTLLL